MSPVKGRSKKSSKKVASAPLKSQAAKSGKVKREKNPLYRAGDKTYGIGQAVPKKRDLGRVMVWPRYVRLARHKNILMKRMKVPPAINQFNLCLDGRTALELFRFADRYRPESKIAKKERLEERARLRAQNKPDVPDKKLPHVRFGINEVTKLVEKKKAKLVVIAHDVDPVELVLFLPALCRRMGVPYCIVKDKARLGIVVGRKTTCCFAFTNVYPEDKNKLAKLIEAVNVNFTERFDEVRKQWGGGVLGRKSLAKKNKLERVKEKELQQRLG